MATPIVNYYLADQRVLLERLALFSGTADYRRLLDHLRGRCPDGDPELWFAEWLITAGFGYDEDRPIDIAAEPGGIEQLVERLNRMFRGPTG